MIRTLITLPLLVALASAQYSPLLYSGLIPDRTVLSYPAFEKFPYVSPIHSVVSSKVLVNPVTVATQYRTQDSLGQYAFGHADDKIVRDEVKTWDGAVRGGYQYVDPIGKLINVQYLADHNGFKVLGANNLPVAPVNKVDDTPEVKAAKEEFFRKFKEEEMKVGIVRDMKMEEKMRSKRDIHSVVLPISRDFITKIKTTEFKPIEDVKTPSATKFAEFKNVEKEIVTKPIVPIHHVPLTADWTGVPLTTFPLTTTWSGIPLTRQYACWNC